MNAACRLAAAALLAVAAAASMAADVVVNRVPLDSATRQALVTRPTATIPSGMDAANRARPVQTSPSGHPPLVAPTGSPGVNSVIDVINNTAAPFMTTSASWSRTDTTSRARYSASACVRNVTLRSESCCSLSRSAWRFCASRMSGAA